MNIISIPNNPPPSERVAHVIWAEDFVGIDVPRNDGFGLAIPGVVSTGAELAAYLEKYIASES